MKKFRADYHSSETLEDCSNCPYIREFYETFTNIGRLARKAQ